MVMAGGSVDIGRGVGWGHCLDFRVYPISLGSSDGADYIFRSRGYRDSRKRMGKCFEGLCSST